VHREIVTHVFNKFSARTHKHTHTRAEKKINSSSSKKERKVRSVKEKNKNAHRRRINFTMTRLRYMRNGQKTDFFQDFFLFRSLASPWSERERERESMSTAVREEEDDSLHVSFILLSAAASYCSFYGFFNL
jgi:hypothetical protein